MTLAAAAATALGSAPIGSTFRTQGWASYAWFGVALIMCTNLVARRARMPAPFVPVLSLVVLTVYLTAAFTPAHTVFGIIPTPEALQELRALLHDGFEDVRTLTTPAPATPGLNLLAAGGVGLVAVVIDAVAVGLRRPAAAGLVLLAMYAVPTAVAFDGVGWLPFVLGACGYLILLLAEGYERTLQWGRPIPYDDMRGQEAENWPIRTNGKRIGVAALTIAVLLSIILPGFENNTLYLLLSNGDGAGPGTSGSTGRLGGSSLNPFVTMRSQLQLPEARDLMEVTTSEDRPLYIRQQVLSSVDSDGNWRPTRLRGGESASGSLDLPSGTQRSNNETIYRATFKINKSYEDDTLPMYGLPIQFDGLDGNWNYVEDLATGYTRSSSTRNLTYSESYIHVDPTEEQLRASDEVSDVVITQDWGRVPDGIPTEVRDTVRRLTQDSKTPYDRELALFNYFLTSGNGFTYTLNPRSGTSGNDLLDFLQNKAGFCQQYASAMAVMSRIAGVPARVVLGYAPDTKRDGKWIVRTDTAHAWVEAYFDGLGWVTFDPTPLSDNRRVEQDYAPRPGVTPSNAADPNNTDATPDTPVKTNPNAFDPNDRQRNNNAASKKSDDGGISQQTIFITAGATLLVLLLLFPLLWRLSTRRRRLHVASPEVLPNPNTPAVQGQQDDDGVPGPLVVQWIRLDEALQMQQSRAAHSAWDEVMATAEDFRVPIPVADSPRATAHRMSTELPLAKPAVAALRLVALAEERARYAPTAGVDGDLSTAVRAVRRGMSGISSRRRRLRAALLPPSTMRRLSEQLAGTVGRCAEVVDRIGGALRRPFRSRR